MIRRLQNRVYACAGPLFILAVGFGMGFTLAVAWATA